MRVFIIEDETPAANRLSKLLLELEPGLEVTHRADSIESSVRILQSNPPLDLIFMDIQLADGLSFDIFEEVSVRTPVVFTTAFDQYTLKAFKVNSIDYLLKPIDENELRAAIKKYRDHYPKQETDDLNARMQSLMEAWNRGSKYKERLLIKRGQQLHYLKTAELAHCFADGKLCYAVDFKGNKYLLETNLSLLEEQLEPTQFFRINRQLMIHIDAIQKVHTGLGGRLKVDLQPATSAECLVSRDRVNDFKEWLGR
ncbi:MAG TPA: LytTR family DNA-binding domain-containing protein [Ferruginibacter sp.]|nr:LytTR family DNA-binding domain-containing protein [Ferruginibacter sp.]